MNRDFLLDYTVINLLLALKMIITESQNVRPDDTIFNKEVIEYILKFKTCDKFVQYLKRETATKAT